MKIDTNNPQHAGMLAKYLSGEMDSLEHYEFESQIEVEEENIKLIQTMDKQWKAIGGNMEVTPDARKAWDKLYARLDAEKLIPGRTAAAGNNQLRNILRMAAIAIVIFGIGSILYLSVFRKQPNSELVQLNTANESTTLIKTLADGSIIYIAQNSLFSFPREFASDKRNVGLEGEAFFDITPDPVKPFVIETDEARIEVLGTAFNVKTKNDSNFELFVNRGKVKVTLKNDLSKSVLVKAGEKISSVNHDLVKSTFANQDILSWHTRRMHFKDEPLRNILMVLNRNFNTTFVTADPETGSRMLTVTFDNETVETMTELICLPLNLKSQVKNDSIVLSENKPGSRNN